MMETNGPSTDVTQLGRKSSLNSIDSATINPNTKPVLRRTNSDNIQQGLKLSLFQTHSNSKDDVNHEVTGANSLQSSNSNQTVSTGCLSDGLTYSLSANITDHFPQKVLAPSNSPKSSLLREHKSGGKLTLNANVYAPVATEEDSSSPEIENSNTAEGSDLDLNEFPRTAKTVDEVDFAQLQSSCSPEESAYRAEHTGYESTSNKVRFLPAYRAKTVDEMMQDRSPRAVFHPSNRSVNRSQSTRNTPNGAPIAYNYSSSTMQSHPSRSASALHPQMGRSSGVIPTQVRSTGALQQPMGRINGATHTPPGRIYKTPSPQIRPYQSISRNRPTTVNVRVNDGTHPRMPMKAVQPQTYHGVPVNQINNLNYVPQNHENIYGTVRRSMPYAQGPPAQGISQSHKASSHGDMRNGNRSRTHSTDNSSLQSHIDGRSIRGANSEPDIEQPYSEHPHAPSHRRIENVGQPVPSGTYVASSSMTSLPQYAQLMAPSTPPHRSDSTGNVRRPRGFPVSVELGTRHSYSAGNYQHKLSMPDQRVNSYDDVFNDSSGHYKRGNTTPTSPVNRQPSFLTAMSAPIRQNHSQRVENGESPYSQEKVVLRSKTAHQTEDSHQKILRRTSYLMATSKPTSAVVEENSKTPNQKYRKLKKFFGEGTPSIKEGQEKALQSYSQPEPFALPDNLEVQKTGILAVKILAIEGKKSHSRSWRGMGAVLSSDMLYLVKDKKENATMLTTPSGSLSIDEKPICIVACFVAIAHSYTKKRHVFKLITSTASEYLFQAEDDKDMLEWIRVIDANRHPDKEKSTSTKSEQLTSAELVKRINDQQVKLNQQKKRPLAGLSFKSKQPYTSPSKNNESGQKDKKKRSSSGPMKQPQFDYNPEPEPVSGDFGMPINECSPSHENEFVPLIVELCTKAIEDRGLDFVGIYRVPGNKAAVELLKKELNQGIINLENDKWRDMNVLSSLLKTYFRRLPESLITSQKYKEFIETNRLPDAQSRLVALKQLIRTLPDYNYETLKYLAIHLRKVAEHGEANKMDTRNLAIVFGPTIVRSGEDVRSLVTDMSDQCRIIESIIVYCDWMFSTADTDPPPLNEAEISSSCAPISETMNNMTAADIATLTTTNKTKSKGQLISAITGAVSKKSSRGSLTPSSISSPLSAKVSPEDRQTTVEDDHGFKNRDLQHEAAARNQRLLQQKEKELREWQGSQTAVASNAWPAQQPEVHQYGNPLVHRWHSEESVLVEHSPKITHDQYPYQHHQRHMKQLSNSENEGTPPPPIPARGVDTKPPLPPKPMQLYHAKPTQIDSPEFEEPGSPGQLYENFEHLELGTPEQITPHRTLRVIHNQLKSSSLRRRGSLDSMMDTLEPLRQYSSTSSTESQDGSDLLSSITTTFDRKLKLLADDKYLANEQRMHNPQISSERSSLSSGGHIQQLPMANNSTTPSCRGSTDQSRESLLSILSNKENMDTCESFSSAQDFQSSDRGFDGSTSSVGSVPYRSDAKIGIASRIERKDIKPLGYPPASSATETRLVNATGSVISHRPDEVCNESSDEDRDFANNNSLDYDDTPLIQRHMSDEKKRVRRRHTVGGARDFELFKDMLSEYKAKQHTLTEPNPANEQESLTAWQRLQPGGNKEPVSLRDWLERERFRASSPEMHNAPNIMHLQDVPRKLSGSLLESNT